MGLLWGGDRDRPDLPTAPKKAGALFLVTVQPDEYVRGYGPVPFRTGNRGLLSAQVTGISEPIEVKLPSTAFPDSDNYVSPFFGSDNFH